MLADGADAAGDACMGTLRDGFQEAGKRLLCFGFNWLLNLALVLPHMDLLHTRFVSAGCSVMCMVTSWMGKKNWRKADEFVWCSC